MEQNRSARFILKHPFQRRIQVAALAVITLTLLCFNNCGGFSANQIAALTSASTSGTGTTGTGTTGTGTTGTGTNPNNPPPPPPITGAPYILYTDIVAGPNSGGENNNGAYLSIFGQNFGASLANISVTIGGSPVARLMTLGFSRARSDIQMLSVQVGSLGNPTPGQALPIQVTVNGSSSNTDHTFIVNPGRFFYFDPMNGNDSTGVVNDITHPFKTVQSASLTQGAWGQVKPGDFLILRNGTYTGSGYGSYFMRFMTSTKGGGSAPTGQSGTGYLTLMGYPGEQAFVDATATLDPNGGIAGSDTTNRSNNNAGIWVVVANLKIEGGGYDGPVDLETAGDDWRIVNNEITATTGVNGKMAGITGDGMNSEWLGNDVHDIVGSINEAHCLYIDGPGSYEVAYNLAYNCLNGKGFQTYGDESLTNDDSISNVYFHHNIIHDTLQFGINIADNSTGNIVVSDNIVYNTQAGGLRFNTTTLSNCKIFNNTFYNTNTSKNQANAALMNDWNIPNGAMQVINNIFDSTGGSFTGGSVGFSGAEGTFSNNLWFTGSGAPKFDKNTVTANPQFENAGSDFHLMSTSPALGHGSSTVSSIVTTDFDLIPYVQGSAYNIGAY